MNNKHKLKKFNDNGLDPIRWEIKPYVAFIVFGSDISVLKDAVNFDLESDMILEKIKKEKEPQKKYAFEYRIGKGFESVDVNSQTWFTFK